MTALKATFTILAVLAVFALASPSEAELQACQQRHSLATCLEAHGG